MTAHQKLPTAGPAREALREKGQFWTPDWVAEAMVAYAIGETSGHLFDPAVGAGAFFAAARLVSNRLQRPLQLLGTELFAEALLEARQHGLDSEDLAQVTIGDFMSYPTLAKHDAIVANPPYIRHHRLAREHKDLLRKYAEGVTGKALDGRAGLHVYFLIKALEHLNPDGRLAFIVPADITEGVFAGTLWNWLSRKYCIDAVVTFVPEAAPFPGVDTNALVLMLSRRSPASTFKWVRCLARDRSLYDWVLSGFTEQSTHLEVFDRPLDEALVTGLSRAPSAHCLGARPLGDYVRVVRGIATGANEFFFLTRRQVIATGIPLDYFIRAIGRTRDVTGDTLNETDLAALDAAGRPTFLLNVETNGRVYPEALWQYLRHGEEIGLPDRTLIATRNPWYKTEVRQPPHFLFAYLGRRNARFIRNLAGVVPLTGFLCVYARWTETDHLDRLWRALNHPNTIAALALVGKSYGDGAIKVEPRALEKTPLYPQVLKASGLTEEHADRSQQLPFVFPDTGVSKVGGL